MFNTPNDCFLSSPASPSGLIFNRQHQNSRYHPYHRIPPPPPPSTTYYPTNELETYSFDNNNNSTTNPQTIPSYDHSIMSYDYNLGWTTTPTSSSIDNDLHLEGQSTNLSGTANKKERRRTQSINTAFSDLRTAIPNVQPDTKLSKIKTLKLATKYIEFLMDILAKDDPTAMPSAFKAEIIKTRKDHRDLIKFDNSLSSRKIKGRTGWPQTVWQSELNRNENFHQHPSSESLTNSPTLSQPSPTSSTTKNKLRTYDKSYLRNGNNEKPRYDK